MDGEVSVLTLSKTASSIAALAVGGTMPAEPWKTTVLTRFVCYLLVEAVLPCRHQVKNPLLLSSV